MNISVGISLSLEIMRAVEKLVNTVYDIFHTEDFATAKLDLLK